MKALTSSSRKYKVVISDNVGISTEGVTLKSLLESDEEMEYIYAMREELDRILDLKIGESIYFQPNRDDKSTKGIIRRAC